MASSSPEDRSRSVRSAGNDDRRPAGSNPMFRPIPMVAMTALLVAGCIPVTEPRSVAMPLPAAPPRVSSEQAVNELYEHKFAEAVARRIAGACPAISVDQLAVSTGESRARQMVRAAGLSDGEASALLETAQARRLISDFGAFTSQTGISYSDPASNCSVARKQIAGGSRIGAYLMELPGIDDPVDTTTVDAPEGNAPAGEIIGDVPEAAPEPVVIPDEDSVPGPPGPPLQP